MQQETNNKFTKAYLVDRYFSIQGSSYSDGRDDECTCLLPVIVLDQAYDIFNKVILPLPLKGELKNLRNRWSRLHATYNARCRDGFTADENDFILSKMDDLYDYLRNDMEIAKVHLMACVPDYDLDTRKVLATSMLYGVLAQAAQHFWKMTNDTTCYQTAKNDDIEGLINYSSTFTRKYIKMMGRKTLIDPNKSPNVNGAVSTLCKKIVRWMYTEWKD